MENNTDKINYAKFLADDWTDTLTSLNPNNQEQTYYLLQSIVPTLVEAIEELGKVYDEEVLLIEENKKARKKDPNIPIRSKFNATHWLASYLIRNNPQHLKQEELKKETVAYSNGISKLLQ